MKYKSAAVPFQKIGNRRGLTAEQLCQDSGLSDFVARFAHCFEHDPVRDVWVYLE